MKKSLIALAVAGAMTAPMIAQADATLYGQVEVRGIAQDEQDFSIEDGTSVLGVKGTVDTNMDGVKALFRMEWDVDNNVGDGNSSGGVLARKMYAGLVGGFGELYIGKQNNPHYAVSGATDIFTRDSGAFAFSSLRVNNTIGYVTPNMGGFDLTVAAVADSGVANSQTPASGVEADDGNDIDTIVVKASYKMGGLGLGLAYTDASGKDLTGGGTDGDVELLSVAASYSMDALYVAAVYETLEDDDTSAEPEHMGIAATYTINDTQLGLLFEDLDADTGVSSDDNDITLISVHQKLGSKVSAYAEYAMYDQDDMDAFTLGYKVKF